jgi:hypothetical protein
VLNLGEINSSKLLAWHRAIEVIDGTTGQTRTLAPCSEDRSAVVPDVDTVQVRLSAMQ